MTNDMYLLRFTANASSYDSVSDYVCTFDNFMGLEELEQGSNIVFASYFNDKNNALSCGKGLQEAGLIPDFTVEQEFPKDYNALWREQVEPVLVAPNVWVSPDWKEPTLTEKDTWVKIEPQMAFGTGHHATTKLSATLLLKAISQKKSPDVIDIGTGSGVLAIIAKMFGASYSLGVENDPVCEENMLYNRTLNNLDGQVDLVIGDNTTIDQTKRFDICVINIIRKYSLPQLPWIHNALNKDGILVWSGIMADDTTQCIKAANDAGFTLIEEATEDKWWAALFKKN